MIMVMKKKNAEREKMMMMMKQKKAERKELIRKCKHYEDILRKRKVFNAIHQILLMNDGVISEFTLSLNIDNKRDEVDKIVTYLSRKNTIKKLVLRMNDDLYDEIGTPYMLPSSIFALHQLTDLYLQRCGFYFLPTINGFGCLTSLFLNDFATSEMVFISSHYLFTRAFMCALFGCLPSVAHLYIDIRSDIQSFWLYESKFVLPKSPTPLVHLKYAHLPGSCFIGKYGLPLAINFIKSSPNLEKLKLLGNMYIFNEVSKIDSLMPEENSDIRLEHLKELEFNVCSPIPKLKFLKLILANSPVLKQVRINLHHTLDKDDELDMLKALSDAPRTSQMVGITNGRNCC
ncbi:F-box/FBD/LRR-repeat protein At1g13570-like [Rutidosis leptorrhynchoides]|uniref:F-box/FBD/LRR-repeat protein At1g13570-like n=1 Tax=Rutidosis leptorrhynchoides TaxID=125765 RepID=UPI003A9941AB